MTLLGRASATETIHYDKSYTRMQWTMAATPRALPGTVRMTLTPANSASKKLAAETDNVWWFGYKYTGVTAGGIATFAEDPTIDMRAPAPNLDLSLSLPGIYFVGIFGSFATGVCKGAPEGGDGFVSQRAPIATLNAAGTETAFQPFAVIIPFGNGTVPPLPAGFKGQHAVLPAIPGDARLALHPNEDGQFRMSMFDAGLQILGGRNSFPPPEKNELVLSITMGCADTVPFQSRPNTPF